MTTADSPRVTAVKCKVLDILMSVADLRANFRLGRILGTFKKINDSAKGAQE